MKSKQDENFYKCLFPMSYVRQNVSVAADFVCLVWHLQSISQLFRLKIAFNKYLEGKKRPLGMGGKQTPSLILVNENFFLSSQSF